jgi:transposase-like protein
MTPPAMTEHYKNHRFPGEIIGHGVWLYYQELLFKRGIDVTYEAIRKWWHKFGQDYANRLRRRRSRPGDKWSSDEVFLTISGKRHYLWRAVDQDDNVLDFDSFKAKRHGKSISLHKGRFAGQISSAHFCPSTIE